MGNTIKESVKLILGVTAGALGSKAITKIPAIQSAFPTFPGAVPAGVATGIFAGSVKFGKSIRDSSLRVGVQAGTGFNALQEVLKMPAVGRMLPAPVKALLDGDSNAVTVGATELEQFVQSELERRMRAALPQGVTVVNGETTGPDSVETEDLSENISSLDGDDSIYAMDGDEIYAGL